MTPHPLTNLRTSNAAPTSGSQTILQTEPDSSIPSGTLRLRAEPEEQQRVRWAEDVVDNEGMGKKSSKVCCIYHKPNEPGDSESDDSSSSSSDSEPDLSRARRTGGKKGKGRRHDHGEGGEGSGKGKGKARQPSPNAYERQPKAKSKSEG